MKNILNTITAKGVINKRALTVFVLLLISLVLAFALTGCQKNTSAQSDAATEETSAVEETTAVSEPAGTEMIPALLTELPTDLPLVIIEMNDGQKITLALYPEYAPNTVNNFIELAESGFYNGLIFHRVINGFMIQGGDPQGIGVGGPGYGIPGEFRDNGFENPINHRPGIISMARSQDPNSAGSQFFICQGETSFLDGQYAAFGQVVTGQEVVDAIATVAIDSNDKPVEDVIIKTVTIERQGYTFEAVEKSK